MTKSEVKYSLASVHMSSNQLRTKVSVVKTSDPPPSDDELLLHQWMAELHSFIHMEAIRDSTQNFEEVWEKTINTVKAPEFKSENPMRANNIHLDELMSSFNSVWNKIKNQLEENHDDR